MQTKQIKNGQAVKIVFGFSRTVFGQISDVVVNQWGTIYEITTEDGDVEYTMDFTNTGMGVHLL